MKTPSKRQVKAWAMIWSGSLTTLTAPWKERETLICIYQNEEGAKRDRSVRFHEEVVPCTITYSVPKKRGVKK